MIPSTLRIILLIGVLIYFVVILHFLKDKALELKYTLLWIVAGVFMLSLVVFPHLLPWLVHLLGIESNMNGLFLLAIAFLVMLSMTLTSIVSRQMRKINRLVQQVAILENELMQQSNK